MTACNAMRVASSLLRGFLQSHSSWYDYILRQRLTAQFENVSASRSAGSLGPDAASSSSSWKRSFASLSDKRSLSVRHEVGDNQQLPGGDSELHQYISRLIQRIRIPCPGEPRWTDRLLERRVLFLLREPDCAMLRLHITTGSLWHIHREGLRDNRREGPCLLCLVASRGPLATFAF